MMSYIYGMRYPEALLPILRTDLKMIRGLRFDRYMCRRRSTLNGCLPTNLNHYESENHSSKS